MSNVDYGSARPQRRRPPTLGLLCLLLALLSFVLALVPSETHRVLNAIGAAFPLSWVLVLFLLTLSLLRRESYPGLAVTGLCVSTIAVLVWLDAGGKSYFGGSP
jgi:hypothetical protein